MMEPIKRPMLSAKFDDYEKEKHALKFPLLATPKLDGIRCVKVDGKALSRTFKPIPNKYVREKLEAEMPDNTDMELVGGNAFNAEVDDFNSTTSKIMSRDGEPEFTAYVLDYVSDSLSKPYKDRIADLKDLTLPDFCVKVLPVEINDVDELDESLENYLEQEYEGMMIRTPDSPYKCGRSSLREGYLVKIKPFVDAEAKIVGYVEQMENTNTKERDAFGDAKRSHAKAGMIPKGALGKWLVKGINGKFKDVEFGLGTAKDVTQEMRVEMWKHKDEYIGKVVTYKFQDFGSVDAPRLPVFKGFRSQEDFDATN